MCVWGLVASVILKSHFPLAKANLKILSRELGPYRRKGRDAVTYLLTPHLLPHKQGRAGRDSTPGLDKTPLYWKSTAKGL